MPGPPTPISACPLKRLEVRDGSSSRSYNSTPPTSVFTFTLNGERPIDKEAGALILVINHGNQLLLSLRLTDILKESPGAKDIMSIDKQLLRLSIMVPGKSYTIIADFEEARDFSVAICLLKKSSFTIKELASSTPARAMSILPSVASLDANISSSSSSRPCTRPQMSSITAFPELYPQISSYFSQEGPSFTNMLNSPLPATTSTFAPLQPMQSSQPYAQRVSSLPHYYNQSSAIVSPPAAQLDQYNPYTGRNTGHFHKPRVSSLLKHSLGFGESPGNRQNSVADYISSQENMYTPTDLSPSGQNSQSSIEYPSSFSQPAVLPQMEQSGTFETDNVNRSVSDMSHPSASVLTHRPESQPIILGEESFRDLLPQPRELPFLSSTRKKDQAELPLRKTASLNLASTSSASLKRPSPTRGSTTSKTASTTSVRSSLQTSASSKVSVSTSSAASKTLSAKVAATKTSRARSSKVPPSRRASKAKASRTRGPKSKDPSPIKAAPTKRTASDRVSLTAKRPSPAKDPPPTRASPRLKRTKPSETSLLRELSPPKIPKASAVPPKRPLAAGALDQNQAVDEPKSKRSRRDIPSPIVDPVVETPKSRIVKLKVPLNPVLSVQTRENRSAEEPSSAHSSSPPGGLPTPISELRTRTVVIIAESSTLRDLDRITSRFCHQYQEDIANGSPEAACEKFYQLQIHKARNDFWLHKLSQGEVMSFEMQDPMYTKATCL